MNRPSLHSPLRITLVGLTRRAGHLIAIGTSLAGVALAWLVLDPRGFSAMAAVAALTGGGARALAHIAAEDGTPFPRTRVLAFATMTPMVVLAAIGLADLAGTSGLLLLAMAVLASPAAHDPLVRRVRRTTALEWWDADGAPVDLPVHAMSVEELCEGWEASFIALEGTTDAVALTRLYHLRQAYLDELERRFPVGFARWIEEHASPGKDPRRHLTH